MLKSIHAQENKEAAKEKAAAVVAKSSGNETEGSCQENRGEYHRNAYIHGLPICSLVQVAQQ